MAKGGVCVEPETLETLQLALSLTAPRHSLALSVGTWWHPSSLGVAGSCVMPSLSVIWTEGGREVGGCPGQVRLEWGCSARTALATLGTRLAGFWNIASALLF